MSEEKHTDKSSSSSIPVTAAVEQSVKGEKVRATATTTIDLPHNAAGNWARIWYVLGPTGAIVVAFISMMFWFMHSMSNQMDALRVELVEARKQASQERKELYDRYTASRETAEKRHADVIAKLDKIVNWVDRLVDWMWRERKQDKPLPPPPKMNELQGAT